MTNTAYHKWLDLTIDKLSAIGDEYGWTCRCTGAAETGSRYWEFKRLVPDIDDTLESIDDYGLTGCEAIIVRLSDHADCYCRSNYSLVYGENSSGDDSTLAAVIRRLSRSVIV